MADIKPYITSTFEEETQEYNKTIGASKGVTATDNKTFQDNVLSYIDLVKSGSFLSSNLKKITTALKKILAKGIGLLNIGKLKSSLLDKLDNTPFSIKSAGLSGLLKLITVSEKISNTIVEKIAGELLSRIFIPEPVYLASLVAFDLAGADLEINDNYIRKLILRRDLFQTLRWWNNTWQISYSGLRSDRYTNDGVISARYGCYKNVEYILGEFNKSYNTLKNSASIIVTVDKKISEMTTIELSNYNRKRALLNSAEEVYANMVYILKELIVSSYSNFTADELRNLLKKNNIQPSVFGSTDNRFGGRFSINSGDINRCAPFYKTNVLNTIDTIANIRSSRYRREYNKKKNRDLSASIDKPSNEFKFINPRNRNIKRLYLVLTSSEFESIMYNPPFAERLGYKIANVFLKSMDTSDLIPANVFKKQQEVWSSAYDYTITIEDFLFNPATVSDLKFVDTEVIKMPKEIESKVNLTSEVIETKQDRTIIDQKNSRLTIIEKTIGPVLIVDSLKYDVESYNNTPFIESEIYDKNGQRVIRDGYGGFIRANDDGTPLLDINNQQIIVDNDQIGLVPKEKKDPKNALPNDLEAYIKRLVDQYLSLNVQDLINSVLLKIKNGEIVLHSSDSIERLAFKNYKDSNGIFYNQINVEQVFPIIINRIQDGTITTNQLKETPLLEIVTNVTNELKDNNEYVTTFNGESTINTTKLTFENLQNNIKNINKGIITVVDMDSFDKMKSDAEISNSNNIIATSSGITDELFLAVKKLNDVLVSLYKSNVDVVSYDLLMSNVNNNGVISSNNSNVTFDSIVDYYANQLNNGKYIPLTLDQIRVELRTLIDEMYDNIVKDLLSINNIPTFIEYNIIAIDKVEDKYNLSDVMDILKEFGIDVTGYDAMKYYREIDRKVNENQDESFYEFNVKNPPASILKSLEDEYNSFSKFKSKYYKWLTEV